MLFPDYPVWYRFLGKYGSLFINLYYDVYVGGPYLTPEEEKDPFKRMYRDNTVKRIDALAELKDEIWIIEVATWPGFRSFGQLLCYRNLWLEDPKIEKIERLCLVCAHVDTDMLAAGVRYGVQVYVLPEPGS